MPRVTLRLDRSSLSGEPFFHTRVAEIGTFDVPELSEEVRHLACRAWEDRASSEYIGVMVMRRFHGLLVDLNAPIDLQELALRMQLQEQEHTALCVAAARSLGSSGEVEFDVAELQQTRPDAPLAALLMDMICGTFTTGEVVALRLITHAIEAVPASSYRDVLRRIARDEVLHARMGPALLRLVRDEDPDWLAYPGDDWVATCVRRHIEVMKTRDVVEPSEVSAFETPAKAEQLLATGIPPSVGFKAAYLSALQTDVPKALASAGIITEKES